MKKYIFVIDIVNLMSQLLAGKHLKGSLFIDDETGRLTFKAYNISESGRSRDELVKKTPWGWVRRSKLRLKRFSSVPLDMTLHTKLAAFDRENTMQKEAIVDQELIEFC